MRQDTPFVIVIGTHSAACHELGCAATKRGLIVLSPAANFRLGYFGDLREPENAESAQQFADRLVVAGAQIGAELWLIADGPDEWHAFVKAKAAIYHENGGRLARGWLQSRIFAGAFVPCEPPAIVVVAPGEPN